MLKVVVFGTFDIFHPGHLSFLNQAKNLGNFLLVVIARDNFVKEIKGDLPRNGETKRAQTVKRQRIANKVVLGSKTHNYFQTLRTHAIDTIALGYDQKPSLKSLKKQLRRHRLGDLKVVRLKPYNPNKYKSSKLQKNV